MIYKYGLPLCDLSFKCIISVLEVQEFFKNFNELKFIYFSPLVAYVFGIMPKKSLPNVVMKIYTYIFL